MTSPIRRPLVAGNWKMHTDPRQSAELALAICSGLPPHPNADVMLLPPYTSLAAVAANLSGRPDVWLGAQNCHWETSGAFTGEVSAEMLAGVCGWVLVGHSERRRLFGETDRQVAAKLRAVLRAGMRPLLAVGESLDERKQGRATQVIQGQTHAALQGLDREALSRCVVAYEPVWAIGTGESATPDDAAQGARDVRQAVAALAPGVERSLRVLYGGSVSASTAASLFAPPDVDGGLIGGASLKAKEFLAIVAAAG